MIRTIAAGLALVLSGTAATVPATAQAVAAQSVPQQIALAYAPADMMRARVAASFDGNFEQALMADPKARSVEAAHPGVAAVAKTAGRNATLATFDARLPDLHAQVAKLFGDNLDGAEQSELLDFMRSPTFATLRGGTVRVLDQSKITADLAASAKAGQPKVTGAQIGAAVDPSFLNRITPDQRERLMAFGVSPAGQALTTLTPRLNEIMARWMTDLIAAQTDAVRLATVAAVREFVSRSVPTSGGAKK